MTHKEYADSLRMIAEFYEAHEEVGLPYEHEIFQDFQSVNIRPLARAFGSAFTKEYDEDFEGSFAISKMFGKIEFRCTTSRGEFCVKKVVGKRHVDEVRIPAREETVIPEHYEDIVEWDCSESLMEKGA